MNQINFILNGLHHSAEFEDGETLLKYLRNTACLKGTKESCGMGQCGACSVLINGKLRRSCVTLMKTLEGKQVETIEGISSDG